MKRFHLMDQGDTELTEIPDGKYVLYKDAEGAFMAGHNRGYRLGYNDGVTAAKRIISETLKDSSLGKPQSE